jgi:hypothetical protein
MYICFEAALIYAREKIWVYKEIKCWLHHEWRSPSNFFILFFFRSKRVIKSHFLQSEINSFRVSYLISCMFDWLQWSRTIRFTSSSSLPQLSSSQLYHPHILYPIHITSYPSSYIHFMHNPSHNFSLVPTSHRHTESGRKSGNVIRDIIYILT